MYKLADMLDDKTVNIYAYAGMVSYTLYSYTRIVRMHMCDIKINMNTLNLTANDDNGSW